MTTEALLRQLSVQIDEFSPSIGVQLHDVDPIGLPIDGDSEEIEHFVVELEDFLDQLHDTISDWLGGRVDGSEFESFHRFFDDVLNAMEDVAFTDSDFASRVERILKKSREALVAVDADPEKNARARRDYYVYGHVDPSSGEIFYIGKGTKRRAWQKNRQNYWKEHVAKIGGNYNVIIFADKLTEVESENLEEQLMNKHHSTIINWIRPMRIIIQASSENADE